jgi:hypothetical protein
MYVKKYRRRGDDPMVSKIIEVEKENVDGNGGGPTIIDVRNPVDDDNKPGVIVERSLNRHETLARNAVMRREYEKVIHHCEEGLKDIKDTREQKNIIIAKSKLDNYERNFARWKRAAEEGIIQTEALENFKKRQIRLDGILWDEPQPVAILDGASFKENDPYKGVRIERISPQRVDVIFMYKGRPFRYTLEFSE